MRNHFDLSAYFIIGPENTGSRNITDIIREAVAGGFTCVQLRTKEASARDLIALADKTSKIIDELGKSDETALLINDRLDVCLAAREAGIKVDGIHVGQSDIPVKVCRKYLGEGAVIGLSAPVRELISVLQSEDMQFIDYLGAAPYNETVTKKDLERDAQGRIITQTAKELRNLAVKSSVPVVVGGGVKLRDLAKIKAAGAAGFFVITAITEAEDVRKAAWEMVSTWKNA